MTLPLIAIDPTGSFGTARRCVGLILALGCALVPVLADSPAPDAADASADAADASAGSAVIEVDGWWLSARGSSREYALVDRSGNLTGGGDVHAVRQPGVELPTFYAAWRPASSNGLELGARLWEYDEQASSATGEFPGNVGALLASPGIAIGNSRVDAAAADSRLRVILVDGGATWHHPIGERAELEAFGGFRLFRLERQTLVTYRRNFGQLDQEFVNLTSDAKGIGPRIAIGLRHRLGRRFSLGAKLGVGLPIGSLEYLLTDSVLLGSTFGGEKRVEEPGTQQAFLQFDGELRFETALSRGWGLILGWSFQQWAGVEAAPRFVDENSQNVAVIDATDATFDGFLAGVRYAF